jgi:hypothetical protein
MPIRSFMIRRFVKAVAACSLSLMSVAVAAKQFNQPLVMRTAAAGGNCGGRPE